MGSYALMGDGVRPEIHASKRPKIRSSGKLPAGTPFFIGEPINIVMLMEDFVTKKKTPAPRKVSPTRFRFSCRMKGKTGLEREIVVDADDAHAGLLQFAGEVAKAGQFGAAAVEAHLTIFATRKFIATFKPVEDAEA